MLRFEWDDRKNRANQGKHGVDFETARLAFDDPHCVTFVERIVEGDQRWHAIGSVENFIVLVVVHTYRGGTRRRSDSHYFSSSGEFG